MLAILAHYLPVKCCFLESECHLLLSALAAVDHADHADVAGLRKSLTLLKFTRKRLGTTLPLTQLPEQEPDASFNFQVHSGCKHPLGECQASGMWKPLRKDAAQWLLVASEPRLSSSGRAFLKCAFPLSVHIPGTYAETVLTTHASVTNHLVSGLCSISVTFLNLSLVLSFQRCGPASSRMWTLSVYFPRWLNALCNIFDQFFYEKLLLKNFGHLNQSLLLRSFFF